MPFKLNFNADTPFALAGHGLLRARGRDAGAFLQAQCMNDVRLLADGQWQYNGWLSPQGRVLALFRLLRIDAEHYVLVMAGQSAQELAQSLSRFVLRSKLDLQADTTHFANGLLVPPGETGPAPTDAAVLPIPDQRCTRLLAIEPRPAADDAAALDLWHQLDMAAGWPWLAPSQRDRWTPHMLSLSKLDAYSLKKGCYPGQEIVARTHYLGRSKRELVPVEGSGLQVDQTLISGELRFGHVVDASVDGTRAVAVIASEAPPAPWNTSAGHPVRRPAD